MSSRWACNALNISLFGSFLLGSSPSAHSMDVKENPNEMISETGFFSDDESALLLLNNEFEGHSTFVETSGLVSLSGNQGFGIGLGLLQSSGVRPSFSFDAIRSDDAVSTATAGLNLEVDLEKEAEFNISIGYTRSIELQYSEIPIRASLEFDLFEPIRFRPMFGVFVYRADDMPHVTVNPGFGGELNFIVGSTRLSVSEFSIITMERTLGARRTAIRRNTATITDFFGYLDNRPEYTSVDITFGIEHRLNHLFSLSGKWVGYRVADDGLYGSKLILSTSFYPNAISNGKHGVFEVERTSFDITGDYQELSKPDYSFGVALTFGLD